VTAPLPERLEQLLGDAYQIDRELGGGGMSRLFLATERSLSRRVVIKLLAPELASEVSAARFKREIEVTAHLQHPHVLPVLAAGARGGLLYYVTPYVAGESLRHRLAQGGALPVRAAVRVLAEVADGRLRLVTPEGHEVTPCFPELAELTHLVPDVVLDGTIVLLTGGAPDAMALEVRLRGGPQGPMATLMLSDVLRLYGVPLLERSHDERRGTLERLDLPIRVLHQKCCSAPA